MKLFKITMRDGKKSPTWYGKVKVAQKNWQRVKLFTDKVASERRLAELQKQADQRAAGMQTAETDRLALPIKELVAQYIASLRLRNANPDSIRIGEWLLNRLIDEGKWQRFSDITTASAESILSRVAETASYQNTFIKRLKAFVHWAMPDNWPDPLKKLKRVREKGAKKTRERRAATVEEAIAFFKIWPTLPPDRHRSYALAMLNSLRRNEIKRDETDRLRWGQLHLNAPIPFVDLKQKMGDGRDSIPLHPYVLNLLREGTPGMPDTPVVAAVPDIKTMKKDLKRAGIEMVDGQGRRLDFHALRHSFQTALDRTGCSRATKKKLMRHANEDVTDGYAHAELSEMLAALVRIPSPSSAPQMAAKAAAAEVAMPVTQPQRRADHLLDHGATTQGQAPAVSDQSGGVHYGPCFGSVFGYNPLVGIDLQAATVIGSKNDRKCLEMLELGPSTQVV